MQDAPFETGANTLPSVSAKHCPTTQWIEMRSIERSLGLLRFGEMCRRDASGLFVYAIKPLLSYRKSLLSIRCKYTCLIFAVVAAVLLFLKLLCVSQYRSYVSMSERT